MRDRLAVLVGGIILVIGILVFLTPEEFKVHLQFFPLSVAATIVLALGVLLVAIGLVSFLAERL